MMEVFPSGWTNNFTYPWIHDSQIYYSDDFALSSSNSAHNTNSILTLNLNVTAQSDLQFMKKCRLSLDMIT